MVDRPHTDDLMDSIMIAAVAKALIRKGILRREDLVAEVVQFGDGTVGPEGVQLQMAQTLTKICDAINRW